jgi:hypothetical protein
VKNLLPVFVVVAGAFAISACAFDPPGERLAQQGRADKALDSAFDSDNADNDSTQAEMAGARGDWAMSVKLGEKSYREQPGIWNEFNLATAYENTGRKDLAEPLYVNLVERGQFVNLHPIQNIDGSWPTNMLATVAQESTRRLIKMGYGNQSVAVSDTIAPYPALVGE